MAGFGYVQMEEGNENLLADFNWIWLADLQRDLKEPLYVDQVHYTAKFSGLIAEAIGEELLRRGVLKKRTNGTDGH